MIAVPQPVLDTLANSFGTQSSSLQKFAGGRVESDGVIYSYPFRDLRRLLKFMVIPEDNQRLGLLQIDERLKFMHYLGENGATIAFPLLSLKGNIYETITFEGKVWIGYCMDIAPGTIKRAESWEESFFQQWGKTIGYLHHLAAGYPYWDASIDPENGEKFLTWESEWQSFYNWCQDEEVKLKWTGIKDNLLELPISPQVFGFIHNDPHIWNLLVTGDKITVLDFDVANHHWFINDIAIACQSILIFHSGGLNRPVTNRNKLLSFLRDFMKGYEQEHHLSIDWIDQLDTFIAYRRILHFIVMNDWLRTKPTKYKILKELILSQPEVVGKFS